MKMITLILILALVSCKNGPETKKVSTPILEIAQSPTNKDSAMLSAELEVYNYEGLKPFLTTTSDKTYIVNFWATWCAPCVKELPYFEQINSRYSDKDVEVILVSLDFPKKYESHLKPFIQKNELKSKVVALNDTDSNTWIPKISEDWSGAIPATLIFNKNKRQFYETSFSYEELETEVKQFLK